MKRGMLPALAMAMAFRLAVSGSALASGAEPATTIGIATANVAWEKPQDMQATFAEIAAAGFTTVRIGLKNPVARSYAALTAAKAAGLDIVVTFPLIDGSVAVVGAEPRAKTKRFFAAYGLSQVDPARVTARLGDLLDFVAADQIPLIGLELGNELNWSGYNGDLPLGPAGKVIAIGTEWSPAVAARFATGLARYRQVFEIAAAALAAQPTLKDVKLVSAGLADINADFIRRSGATYVAPDLVYAAYAEQRVFALIDAVGIHLYEPLRAASKASERVAMIDDQLGDCGGPAFNHRPCWITEFGSALPQDTCASDDSGRIALIQPLLDHLATRGGAAQVPFAFYYDWNADKGFALKRCGRTTSLAETLSGANGAAPQP